MTLAAPDVQETFAAGMVPAIAPHLIPANGVELLRNYLLDDDGSMYKRPGTTRKTAVFEAGSAMTFCWDGFLAGGHRTVVASRNKLGVLDVDDETIIQVADQGLPDPARAAVLNGIMFLPQIAYAGSRRNADYAVGTVAVTEGSPIVSGSGTAWDANVDAGMLMLIGDHLLAVQAVNGAGEVELSSPWPGATAAGLTYSARVVYVLPGSMYPGSYYAVAGNRLLALSGSKLRFSGTGTPAIFAATDYHEIPSGVTGSGLIGLEDRVYIFTTGGLFAVLNIAYDLEDPFGDVQQRLVQLNEDLILWDNAGLATWENAIVAPCADGVWLIPTNAAPRVLSRSIRPLYQGYVVAGQRTGLATVYRGHYVLPVLNTSAVVSDLLLARADRPVDIRGFGTIYPWTSFKDAGGELRAVCQRITDPAREPVLLGAAQSGELVFFGDFTPDGKAEDHDGSIPVEDLILRDWPSGPRNINHVKKLRLRYELLFSKGGAGMTDSVWGEFTWGSAPWTSDHAQLELLIGSQARPQGSVWGSFAWGTAPWTAPGLSGFDALPDTAPETDGDDPFTWRINKRLRFLRARLRCTHPAHRLVIRSVETIVRPSGRQ